MIIKWGLRHIIPKIAPRSPKHLQSFQNRNITSTSKFWSFHLTFTEIMAGNRFSYHYNSATFIPKSAPNACTNGSIFDIIEIKDFPIG